MGAVRFGDPRLQLRHVVHFFEHVLRPGVGFHHAVGFPARVAGVDIIERDLVGGDDAILAAGLDDHVA